MTTDYATHAEQETDAIPTGPLCPVCQSTLVPGCTPGWWRCEHPEAHGFNADVGFIVYPDWVVGYPPLDAATARALETAVKRAEVRA